MNYRCVTVARVVRLVSANYNIINNVAERSGSLKDCHSFFSNMVGGDNMIHRMSTPIRVDIILNQDCNHKCIHCYNPWREQCNKKEEYNTEMVIRNIDIIASELKKANVWSAILTGGEPLLHPEVLFYCVKKLNEFGVSMSINTNLTLITPEIIESLLVDYNWNNIILTSLPALNERLCDEITRVKGSYRRIIDAIDLCVEKGIRVGINTVITKKNIGDLVEYVEFVKRHKVVYVSISIVIPPSYDVGNKDYYLEDKDIVMIANTLLELQKETGIEIGSVTPLPLCILKDADKYIRVLDTTCLAGVSKCSIDAVSGEVFACAHEEVGYGNIFSDGLQKCWDNMSEWSMINHLTEECRNCKWLFICGGECRMMKCGNRKLPLYTLDSNADISFVGSKQSDQIEWPAEMVTLEIDNSFKYRKESFGYVVRCGYTETMMSEPLFRLCTLLKDKQSFSVGDLSQMIGNFDKAKPIINTLIQRKIIVRKA